MNRSPPTAAGCLLAMALVGAPPTWAEVPSAAALLALHAELSPELADNPFRRPLVLASRSSTGRLQGDVYTRIDRPFAEVRDALQSMDHWCDILILHMNVKACRASGPAGGEALSLYLGLKTYQKLADAHRLDLAFVRQATAPGFLHLTMAAGSGPFGTSHYLIVLEAVPLDRDRSFVHLSYSYAYGLVARLALHGYLATSGRGKVGFSIVGHDRAGRPTFQGGLRGVVERNTMRYYLAIEAYLGALALPLAAQTERRIEDWHTSVERFPVQLHDLAHADYVDMKRREIRRQRELGPLAAGG